MTALSLNCGQPLRDCAYIDGWRALPAKQRGAIVRQWGELLLGHQDDLARPITAEQGKPRAEANGEVV